MSTPGKFPLNLYRGDSYTWQFKLWLDAAKTVPLDLTDAVAKSEIRDRSAGDVINELSCTIEPPNVVVVSLSASQCAALPAIAQVWDLQITFLDGSVNTIVAGAVTITGDVTDSTPGGGGMMMSMMAPSEEPAPEEPVMEETTMLSSSPTLERAPRLTVARRT
jgi:hypothetical protein